MEDKTIELRQVNGGYIVTTNPNHMDEKYNIFMMLDEAIAFIVSYYK